MGKKTNKLPVMSRVMVLDAKGISVRERGDGDSKRKTYRFAASSEFEVVRYDWFRDEKYIEVLSHEPGAIVLDSLRNKAPLLFMHDTWTQIGVVEGADVEDKRLWPEVRFSKVGLGPDMETDFNDDIRTQVSIRYIVHERKVINGDAKEGKLTRKIATKWEPIEVSLVSMAADQSVGKGRNATEERMYPVVDDDGAPVEEEVRNMRLNTEGIEGGGAPTLTPAAPAATPAAAVTVGAAGREREMQDILDLCRSNDIPDRTQVAWLNEGVSADVVSRRILDGKKKPALAQPGAEAIVELSEREAKQYSYARAVDGVYTQSASKGHKKFSGFEREVHDEILRKMPQDYDYKGGALVPLRLRPADPERSGKRALDTKTLGKGSELVSQQPGEMIELLREESALGRAGARFLTGLTSKIPFPKKKSGMNFVWVAENPAAGVADSDIGLGISWLDPKALAGMNIFSRQLLLMALADVDTLIRDEIAEGTALALDLAGIHGKGGEGVPLGIYKTPGVTPVAFGGVPTFAKSVDLFAQIRKKNGLRGRPSAVTTPEMAGKMMTVPKFTNGVEGIWTGTFDQGNLVGYPAFATNQVSATMSSLEDAGGTEHGIIAGNFGDLLIGTFAALEVTADPYTLLDKAMVRMVCYLMADTLLRHGESLAVSTGATLT